MKLCVLEESIYQCSDQSTAKEIEAVYHQAETQGTHGNFIHPLVLFDEASLAGRALKAVHEHQDHAIVASVTLSNFLLVRLHMSNT